MNEKSARNPKDRDFLRTQEGLLFCVTGYLHPPERYTAYLKYSPASEGKWRDAKTAYRRELPYYHVQNVAKTIHYLEESYPAYVDYCPVRDFRFSLVPRDRVAEYYLPEARLQEIVDSPQDRLEEEVRGLVLHLATNAGIEPTVFGVTGSVLIELHNPSFSDIDLTVYGLQNARRLRDTLGQAKLPHVSRVSDAFIAKWAEGIATRFPLTPAEARHFARRRWNYGYYRGRYFSIHPIRTDPEIGERYGDHYYRRHGVARVQAQVIDASQALFMPAIYRVGEVEVVEGDSSAAQIDRVVAYEGLYRDVVNAGHRVDARGTVETVDGQPRRLVIGTFAMEGKGYIKPLDILSTSDRAEQ